MKGVCCPAAIFSPKYPGEVYPKAFFLSCAVLPSLLVWEKNLFFAMSVAWNFAAPVKKSLIMSGGLLTACPGSIWSALKESKEHPLDG